jgi:hypothetical protein
MSVRLLWTRLKPGGSDGDTNKNSSTSTITLNYLAWVDGITNNPNEIRRLRGITKEGDSFGGGTSLVCTGVGARQDDNQPRLWHLTIRYEGPSDSESGSDGAAKEIERALLEPIQVRTDSDEIIVPFVEEDSSSNDRTGLGFFVSNEKPVVNSCGMPFTPAPEKMDGISWIEFQRNEQDRGVISAASWRYTVNSDNFMGVRPRESLLRRASAQIVWSKNQTAYWWRATYLFCFKKGGWDIKLMDRGFYHKKTFESPPGSGRINVQPGEFVRNVDANGVPYVEPQRLNGDGHLLGPDDRSVFISFKTYPQRAHSALGLPQFRVTL